MSTPQTRSVRSLINRLARLDGAQSWSDDLNPTQVNVLDYLVQANRFSRSPSHIAAYLGTTRGTMSQSLKTLARKGYIRELKSVTDKRSISFDVTSKGHMATRGDNPVEAALARRTLEFSATLDANLKAVLEDILQARNGRAFGLCHSCQHHRVAQSGLFCTLMSVPLMPEEADQICHEHTMSAT